MLARSLDSILENSVVKVPDLELTVCLKLVVLLFEADL